MFEIVVHIFLLMKNMPRHGREKNGVHYGTLDYHQALAVG